MKLSTIRRKEAERRCKAKKVLHEIDVAEAMREARCATKELVADTLRDHVKALDLQLD